MMAGIAGIGAEPSAPLVLPPETGLFRAGTGAEIANAQCLACHSVEYVTTQPPFARAFWKASIEKMRLKFGAAIPDDQAAVLLDYLVANYGKRDGTTNAPGRLIAPDGSTASDARSVMVRSGCFNCHQAGTKLVGPSYRQVAAKYASDPEGGARVKEQIRNGGGGKWGPIPMPPASGLAPEQIEKIASWILEQK